jgi:glutathione peroxidase
MLWLKVLGLLLIFSTSHAATGLTEMKFVGPKAQEMSLKSLGPGPFVVINIATRCGFTRQLDDLEKLFQQYKDRGVRVVGIPTNDFAGQTPEGDEEVVDFCRLNHGVTFPVGKKVTLSGEEASPFFQALIKNSPTPDEAVAWNFEKFVVSSDGKTVRRFKSRVEPLDKELTAAIEGFLN